MLKFTHWIFCIFLFISHSLCALTTLIVTSNTDDDPGGMGNVGELRYYLNLMNENLSTGTDNYAITFQFPMTITLNGSLPIINNSTYPVSITIGNSGSIPPVTIDGNGAYSGFFIPNGNVTIQNMNFQNLIAKGGDGGDGISGGGGGMGAGGAIYAPTNFLNGTSPMVTLMNVSIRSCTAQGGTGGKYLSLPFPTGDEGGGGGGGFAGNGGSITVTGDTGGGGGGGFGGKGGDVTLSLIDLSGGGGGGGGGLGSLGPVGSTNLGNGGSDQSVGADGNGDGLSYVGGTGGGGYLGGNNAGGGGGGAPTGGATSPGGGGGGSHGSNGLQPQSTISGDLGLPSGGSGGDGGGGGGAAVVQFGFTNGADGQGGDGGYGGGGGGGAGSGDYHTGYTVQGGRGGYGGGGGGGGVNLFNQTPANGGDSLGGGGGGGGGPSDGSIALGGIDEGSLGGGAGGNGASTYGSNFGGGGGGGGSGLGAAVFVDTGLIFTIQAISGVPTTFNTTDNTVQSGTGGAGGPDATDGLPGSALGNSIFLRSHSTLTFTAADADDLLTLGNQVAFIDDTSFGGGATLVHVTGNGNVVYNGTTDYQGSVRIDNANFKVNGEIDEANISVCRNSSFSSQKGTLSGTGILTGDILVNSGIISPDTGETLTLGSLTLNSGSSVYIDINASGTSLVDISRTAGLAGTLEINLETGAQPGVYTILTSTGLTGTFDSVTFTGQTPNYTLSYLPTGAPTFVQFNFLGYPSSAVDIPATLNGSPVLNASVVCCGRPVILGPLPISGTGPTIYSISSQTGNIQCQIKQTESQTYLKMHGHNGSCTIIGTKDGTNSNPLTIIAP